MQTYSLVSIIMPCYNAERYIGKAIESVLEQTYTDWELLVVDDCSTDNSADIIRQYAERDSRIRYLKTDTPSGSPSQPRNIGFDHVRGRFIALLDSDDVWLPRKLEEQLAFMQEHGHRFVYSDYEKISPDGRSSGRVVRAPLSSSYWDALESCGIPCLTALFDKELVSGIRFRPVCKEDYVLWLELLRKGVKAYNTGQVHALYREAPGSRSANKLAMFRAQWHVLRQVEGVKFNPALYFMLVYAIKGLRKYFI